MVTTPQNLIATSYPILTENGVEFNDLYTLFDHLATEQNGHYLLSNDGYWHGGIHISSDTTPWCALAGSTDIEANERLKFTGKQSIRAMADGEIVAYRVSENYAQTQYGLTQLPIHVSTSFVLVKHYIKLGEKKESELTFYTLYMHLAPASAYTPKTYEVTEKNGLNSYASKNDIDLKQSSRIIEFGTKLERVSTEKYVSNRAKSGKPVNNREYAEFKLLDSNQSETFWVLCDRGEENIKALDVKPNISPWLQKLLDAQQNELNSQSLASEPEAKKPENPISTTNQSPNSSIPL